MFYFIETNANVKVGSMRLERMHLEISSGKVFLAALLEHVIEFTRRAVYNIARRESHVSIRDWRIASCLLYAYLTQNG